MICCIRRMLLVIVKDESGKMIDGRVHAHALQFHKLSPVLVEVAPWHRQEVELSIMPVRG